MTNIRQFLKTVALTRLPQSWLLPLKSWHYRRVLRAFNDSDEPDLTIVRRLVAPGTTAIDLGANIGVYTKVLSSIAGPEGRVIGVEPVGETFDVLRRNVEALGMTNVRLVNAAVSDKSDFLTMEIPNYQAGGENFYQAQVLDGEPGRVEAGRRITVRSMSLDDIASGEGTISFVKCDVEGHELKCLAGADRVITQHHPAWLIEVWGDPDARESNAAKVFAQLEGKGYGAWLFDGRLLHLRGGGDRGTNYFFLTETHISRLRNSAPGLVA